MGDQLTKEERGILLVLGRQAIEAMICNAPPPRVDREKLPGMLLEPGATFVTLTINGELRGCVGALEPYQPLVDDVMEHAVAAASQDFRFPPISLAELPRIQIEISRLTLPKDVEYSSPQDLLGRLRPNVDGVTLFDGWRRATFLPQVWEKLPDPSEFLGHLCYKMGAVPDLWRIQRLRVQTYQVEEFHD